jgi:hypothetical protein
MTQLPNAERSNSPAALSFAKMHLDLGLAYREMGLLADAIREWLLSAEHPDCACESWLLIAQAYLALQDNTGAFAALEWSRLLSPTHAQLERACALAQALAEQPRESVAPVSVAPVSRIVPKAKTEIHMRPSADLGLETSIDRALDDIFDLS